MRTSFPCRAALSAPEYVTEFVLTRMRLPHGARVAVDCGVRRGVMMQRPMQVRLAVRGRERDARLNALHDDAEATDPRLMRELGAARVVEELPDGPLCGTYSEADDRLVSFVFFLQRQALQKDHPDPRRRPYWPEGTERVDAVVCSEDQDVPIGLAMHFGDMLRAAGRDVVRVWWRHYGGSLAFRSPNKSTEVVDVGRLASALDAALGFALGRCFDGSLLLGLVALAHTCDYAIKLKGLGAKQWIRALLAHPGRYRDLFLVDRGSPGGGLDRPVETLVSHDAFRRLVLDAFAEAHKKRKRFQKAPGPRKKKAEDSEEEGADDLADFDALGHALKAKKPRRMIEVNRADQSPTQAPIPSEEAIRCHAARVAWCLDKMRNAVRSGYAAQSELALDPSTRLPLHGFARGPDGQVAFSAQVSPREYYGVLQRKVV